MPLPKRNIIQIIKEILTNSDFVYPYDGHRDLDENPGMNYADF